MAAAYIPHAGLRHASNSLFRDFKEPLPVEDFAAGGDRVFRVKGGIPYETFEHDHAQGPPVALLSVALLLEHLQRH